MILGLVLQCWMAALAVQAEARPASPVPVLREVFLMGTRCRLVSYSPSRQEGLRFLEDLVGLLEKSEQDLSTWRDDSFLSSLNRHPIGRPFELPAGFCTLFQAIGQWRHKTGGTFDPAIGRLIEVWDLQGAGRVPSSAELRRALSESGWQRLRLEGCRLTRDGPVRLDSGAFGKGAALDFLREAAGAQDVPWLVDLGGQVAVSRPRPGDQGWEIGVAAPQDRGKSVLMLHLKTGSLATSAGSERDLKVEGARVGHILDPRSGRPAGFQGSVTVWHQEGLAADILSTALYVMGPEEGLRWADQERIAACFIIPQGRTHQILASAAFRKLRQNGTF